MRPRFFLWFWLHVLDALAALGLFGSPLYLWGVTRAADAEWSDVTDVPTDLPESIPW